MPTDRYTCNRLWLFMMTLVACGGDGFEQPVALETGQAGSPGDSGGAGAGGTAAGHGGAGSGGAGSGGQPAGSGGAGAGGEAGSAAGSGGAGQGGAGASAGGAGSGGAGAGGKVSDGSCLTKDDCEEGQSCVPDPAKLFSKLHCAPNDGSHLAGCAAPVTACGQGDCCDKLPQGYVCNVPCKEDWECPVGTVCRTASFKGSCGNYTTSCRPELPSAPNRAPGWRPGRGPRGHRVRGSGDPHEA